MYAAFANGVSGRGNVGDVVAGAGALLGLIAGARVATWLGVGAMIVETLGSGVADYLRTQEDRDAVEAALVRAGVPPHVAHAIANVKFEGQFCKTSAAWMRLTSMRSLTLALVLAACPSPRPPASTPPAPSRPGPPTPVVPVVQADAPCAALPRSAARWGIVVSTAELTRFADAFLGDELTRYCTDSAHVWTAAIRRCFADADTATAIDACKPKLAQADLADLTAILADVNARITEIASNMPAADCPRVATAHYGDVAWVPYLESPMRATTRTRMIARARQALENACTTEGWDAAARACVVAARARDTPGVLRIRDDEYALARAQCFAVIGETQWSYPPAGVLASLGRCGPAVDIATRKLFDTADVSEDPSWRAAAHARVALALVGACERRRWNKRRLNCLREAADADAVSTCLALAPTDPLGSVLYEHGALRDEENWPNK